MGIQKAATGRPSHGAGGLEIHGMPGHLIRRMHQISVSIFLEAAASVAIELTQVQYAALKTIEAYPGLDQSTLAGEIAYDRVTIGGVIDRLRQKRLVRRDTATHDRRAKSLYLEVAGSRVLAALDPVVRRAQERMLDGLDPSERATFLDLLGKATDAANERSRAPFRPARARPDRGDSA